MITAADEAGANVRSIMDQTGHRSLETVMRYIKSRRGANPLKLRACCEHAPGLLDPPAVVALALIGEAAILARAEERTAVRRDEPAAHLVERDRVQALGELAVALDYRDGLRVQVDGLGFRERVESSPFTSSRSTKQWTPTPPISPSTCNSTAAG